MLAMSSQDYEKDFFDGFEIRFDTRINSITPIRLRSMSGYTYIQRVELKQ